MDLLGTLVGLFTRYGYAAVVLGVMAENAGIPLPGETILLAAGFFASQGHFQLWLVIVLAAVGAIVGDNVGYLLGEKVARPFLQRRGRFLLLTPSRLKAMEVFFHRHGDKTILLARFVSGLRVVAALFAGLSGMPWPRFVLYNAAGATLWAGGVGLLGFFFGASWKLLEKWLGLGGVLLLGAAGLALLLLALLRHARALRTSVAALLPRALGRREGLVLLANLTALALFSKVIEDVVSGEATSFDRVLLAALHPSSPSWKPALVGVSALGSVAVVLLTAGALAWVLLRRNNRRGVVYLMAAAGIAEATAWVLSSLVGRGPPGLSSLPGHLPFTNFPSGHTMAATATYGMAAYLAGRLWPTWRGAIRWGAVLMVVGIGLSRIALAADWPTDVLGGFAGGLVILWAAIYGYEGSYSVVLKGLALLGVRSAGPTPGPGSKRQDDLGRPADEPGGRRE